MAYTTYNGYNTRPHWGGANSDADIHLEIFEGEIDTAFQYQSFFRANSNFRSVQDRSNTIRIDRMGTLGIKSRKSGEALESQRVTNDKLVVTVDTLTYARTPIDYQDDWTAPDTLPELARLHGTEHAKLFDQAHIIQLMKCRNFVAPAHLAGAFFNGIEKTATINADKSVYAENIQEAHASGLTELINRDLGASIDEAITLVTPEIFDILLHHDKLMSVDFSNGNGNFAMRRMGYCNGVRLFETPRFPSAVITNHQLGTSFNVDSTDVACKMLTYIPRLTLVAVEAKPLTVQQWQDQKEFANVLDSYAMYTIGQRRPDAMFAVKMVTA